MPGLSVRWGPNPKRAIEETTPQSTRENLQAAIDGEVYERDTMYPAFIDAAKSEKNGAAVKTFVYALKTEAEHARLFADALKTWIIEEARASNISFATIVATRSNN